MHLNSTGQSVTGTISYINPSSHSTDQSGKLFNAEILIDNPGAIKDGQKASAEVNGASGSISSPETGLLSYASSQVLECDSDGKVANIDLKEDQFVNQATILMTLSNDGVVAPKDASELKIKDLQAQLDYANKQLEDYKIYSPMDGTISKQDIKVGEIPKIGEAISYLSDLTHMELVVSIDDTDIAKIKLGQKTSAKVDALPETSTKPLELLVTKIPVEGVTVNGTTTYPVTFAIDNVAELYLLGGLDKPSSRSIKINGRELSTMKDKEQSIMRRRDVGFVFQFYNLIPNLDVEENIMLPILLDGKRMMVRK